MTYAEAKHRIIVALPDDFLQDDGNRIALSMMEKALKQLEKQEDYFTKMFGKKEVTDIKTNIHEDVIKMETGVVTDKHGNVIKVETPLPEYLCTI